MPVPGGTIFRLSNAFCPHFNNQNLSLFLSNSIYSLILQESSVPKESTCILWSITSSTGTKGLIIYMWLGLILLIAVHIEAKSTIQGTPV